jgi:UDP-3-O-[3-hydroxymyristoyl] glucosamine N-acyltransferase
VSWTLAELASRVSGEVAGDGRRRIEAIRTLEAAGPADLSFLTSPRYREAAKSSRAGALLVGRREPELPVDQLVVRSPSHALAQLLTLFHPEPAAAPGAHPTAIVGEGCAIDPSAHLGAYVVVGAGATIGPRAVLHPHVVVGERCAVGEASVLFPHAVLYPGVTIGARCRVHAGVVLGADGFGYASDRSGHTRIPQVGDVAIGDDVEIGALSAVDRALLGTTAVGDGTKIDNLVQVGHNVVLGRGVILCGQAGLAGSARLGDGVVVGGQAGIGGHLEIGAGVRVASKSAVYESVPAGKTVAGIPATEIQQWRRGQALMRRLGEIWRRVRELERRTGANADGTDGGGES